MLLKIGWVSKFMIGKKKRGTGGLGQPPIPLMWRRWGEDPVMAPGSFPPKGGEKYYTNYIKLILKRY